MSKIRPLSKRPGRLIIVNDVKWKYRVGKSNVIAYSEHGERRCEQAWRIKGFADPNTFSRGQWKKSGDGMLMPREIVKWLST